MSENLSGFKTGRGLWPCRARSRDGDQSLLRCSSRRASRKRSIGSTALLRRRSWIFYAPKRGRALTSNARLPSRSADLARSTGRTLTQAVSRCCPNFAKGPPKSGPTILRPLQRGRLVRYSQRLLPERRESERTHIDARSRAKSAGDVSQSRPQEQDTAHDLPRERHQA